MKISSTTKALWLALLAFLPVSAWGQEFGDGTYLVGRDVAPGVYRAPGGSLCYWSRLSGLSGEFSDILANDFGKSRPIVELKEDDKAFATDGCGTWQSISDRKVMISVDVVTIMSSAILLGMMSTFQDVEVLRATLSSAQEWSTSLTEDEAEYDQNLVAALLASLQSMAEKIEIQTAQE